MPVTGQKVFDFTYSRYADLGDKIEVMNSWEEWGMSQFLMDRVSV